MQCGLWFANVQNYPKLAELPERVSAIVPQALNSCGLEEQKEAPAGILARGPAGLFCLRYCKSEKIVVYSLCQKKFALLFLHKKATAKVAQTPLTMSGVQTTQIRLLKTLESLDTLRLTALWFCKNKKFKKFALFGAVKLQKNADESRQWPRSVAPG